MPHPDDSFWLAIFRKSPVVATPMAICGLIGFGLGAYYFCDPQKIPSLRLILCLLVSCSCAGIFVGLIIGVLIDSLIGVFRGKDDKKRRRKRH